MSIKRTFTLEYILAIILGFTIGGMFGILFAEIFK